MFTVDPEKTPKPKLYHYLTGAIGPRPIAFASTIDENGVPNLAPFSFFNAFGANPPILVFSPTRSGRTNETKDSYNNVKKIPECVINVVNYDIVQQASVCSSPYDSDVDEFVKSGLTPIPSDLVKPFRVKESPVQMECKVIQVIECGTEGIAPNLIICEVVRIHIKEEILNEEGLIDQHKIDLVARMDGNWYCRANEASMFEVEKPIARIGIGFDNIPKDILNSEILTGNDLGKLASIESIPDETEVNEYKLIELSEIFVTLGEKAEKLEQELHKLAKKHLKEDRIVEAWKVLLAFNNQ